MKFVSLVSGGKDSVYNTLRCLHYGHDLVALANLHPTKGKDEMDSFMFQSAGHEAIEGTTGRGDGGGCRGDEGRASPW